MDFRLDKPLTVTPVSPQEAARLAQGLYSGGPTLYRRANYDPYGRPYRLSAGLLPPLLTGGRLLLLAVNAGIDPDVSGRSILQSARFFCGTIQLHKLETVTAKMRSSKRTTAFAIAEDYA